MSSHGTRSLFRRVFLPQDSFLIVTVPSLCRPLVAVLCIVAAALAPAAGYCFDFSGGSSSLLQSQSAPQFTCVQAIAPAKAVRPNCAANALSHILNGVTADMLQEQLKGYTAGAQTTMLGMRQVAAINGTQLRGAAFGYDDLRQAQGAVIAHLDLGEGRGHYVDVLKVTEYAVTYLDNRTVSTVSRAEFESVWTGAVLTEETQGGRDLTAREMQAISGGWDIAGAIGGAVNGIASAITSTAGAAAATVQSGISAATSAVGSIGAALSASVSPGAANVVSASPDRSNVAASNTTVAAILGAGSLLAGSGNATFSSGSATNSSVLGVPFAHTLSGGSLVKDLLAATTPASKSGTYVDRAGRTVEVTTNGFSYEARDSRGMIVASGSGGSWGNEIYSQSLKPAVTAPAGISGAPAAGQRPAVPSPASAIDIDRRDPTKINVSQLADGQIVRLPGNALIKDRYYQWDAAKHEFYEIARPAGVEPSANVRTAGINLPAFNGLSGLMKGNRSQTGMNNVIMRTQVFEVKEAVREGGDFYQDPDGNIVSVTRNGSAYEVRDSRGNIICGGSGGSWGQDPYSSALAPVAKMKSELTRVPAQESVESEVNAGNQQDALKTPAESPNDQSTYLDMLIGFFVPSARQQVSQLLDQAERADSTDARKGVASDIAKIYRTVDDPAEKNVINSTVINADSSLINERNRAIWDRYGVIVLESQRSLGGEEAALIDSTLSALPRDHLPETISLEGETQDFSGQYDPSTRTIVIPANTAPGGDSWSETWYRQTLVHEIAHYNDLTSRIEPFSAAIDCLVPLSWDPKTYNYAREYGQTNKVEDYATMQEGYFTDSRSMLYRGIVNIVEHEDDTFLQKVANVVSSYQHTRQLDDGQSVACTYTYAIDGDSGDVIRSEVALQDASIDGKSYLLPDFGRTYETVLIG